MQLIINGQQLLLPEEIRMVNDLVDYFELTHKIVVIEIDQQIIEKTAYAETALKESNRIEIIHFVGGG